MAEQNYDTYREGVAGRADVEDTPELIAYYRSLESLEAGALWTVANKIEPWEPKSESVPVLWRYRDMREHVLRSVQLVSPEKAGRRVIYLSNPGRRDVSAAVGWLYSGLQVMHPGEVASAHAHSSSALRFIMEGTGAYTVVDGHKMTLGRNDFVLTPNGTWHEHGVADDGSPCIWQDGLDIPLVNALEAGFYAVHPDLRQAVTHAVNDSTASWGAPGLRPQNGDWNKRYSPLFKYEWEPTYEALVRHAHATDGSPFDGVLMHYVNPVTGGPVMSTIGASMQLLRPGEHTRAHRHTGSFIYQVAKGSGYSIINGKRLDWTERDIFCVPSWAFHEHANLSSSDDACLFCFNDLPVMHALNLYREEALVDNGGHQTVAV
ncbi:MULTISPECIES: cupin domain-containing protein [unclassified Caballeronia]|uniref:cupin domain-containing protein n=1 Tax=unclassified Caballeronia TaxID=2646786 RepID=UPI001F477289|nr:MULTISPECIES: cupin domain-containing protein [unclassified Caballeronia]MCE4548166.1 cupin domain-containing protein [Caballeronia sp. PC1]MCE4575831.1 cupin domain-containing protein [Caballeronia sp. CLC5]